MTNDEKKASRMTMLLPLATITAKDQYKRGKEGEKRERECSN